MAEKSEKKSEKKPDKKAAEKQEIKKPRMEEDKGEVLVRIFGYDIPGSRSLYAGLTRIKGVSWAISNATCIKLALLHSRKIEGLTKEEIQRIESFLKTLPLPDYLKNRRQDIETGETAHFIGSDLDIKREFDIKRLKEIKSYRGIRHSAKLPVRGQRTRSHFRTKGRAMGVKRKKA